MTNTRQRKQKDLQKNRNQGSYKMFILEFGIWVLPFTFVLAPPRRLALLVAKLQELHETMINNRYSSLDIMRLARINWRTLMM